MFSRPRTREAAERGARTSTIQWTCGYEVRRRGYVTFFMRRPRGFIGDALSSLIT